MLFDKVCLWIQALHVQCVLLGCRLCWSLEPKTQNDAQQSGRKTRDLHGSTVFPCLLLEFWLSCLNLNVVIRLNSQFYHVLNPFVVFFNAYLPILSHDLQDIE